VRWRLRVFADADAVNGDGHRRSTLERRSLGAAVVVGTRVGHWPYAWPVKIWGVGVAAAVAAIGLAGCSQSAFCNATGRGPTPLSAIHAYLSECGTDYTIWRGPYDGDKQSTEFADYNALVEVALNVRDNSEGRVAFLLVGQRTPRGQWRTLGRPGTGP
jgi:hypothetical protein